MGLDRIFRRYLTNPMISPTLRSCCFPTLLLLASCQTAPSVAQVEEVDCGSITLTIAGSAYKSTCKVVNDRNYVIEVLETTAADGTHFLKVIDHTTSFDYVFTGEITLQNGIKDYFTELRVDQWRPGSVRDGFQTGEFAGDCVAFEQYSHRHAGAWRRRIIGFGCSQTGNRDDVYAAMEHVNFPD
jgi:hypothetical protein